MKNSKLKNITPANKIKIALILLLVFMLVLMIKATFFENLNDSESTNPITQTPSAPIEIDTREYFKEKNNSTETINASLSLENGQKSIDRIFSSLIPTQVASAAIQPHVQKIAAPSAPPPMNFMNPSQFPSLRATTSGGSQTFNAPPPMAELNHQNQEPVFQNISIYGVNCFNNECQASTNVGTLKKGDQVIGNEKVELISMAGVKTNKRMITY